MMKNSFVIIYIFALFLAGCHEADKLLFDDIARVQMSKNKEIRYDFFYQDRSTVTRDTVYLEIHTIGLLADRPRKIALKQVQEYDVTYEYDDKGNLVDSVVREITNEAVPGVHYVPMEADEMKPLLLVQPGKVNVTIPVILLRDLSLRTEEVRLCLKLVATDDFQLGESDQLSRTIIFSDQLSRPSAWDKRMEDYYFGKYSTRKHEFMYEVAGEKIDNAWFERLLNDFGELSYFVDKFTIALAEYNSDPDNLSKGLAPMREDPDDPESDLVVFE